MMLERYQTIEAIGRGGLGMVTRARDVHMGRDVAIKRLLPETALSSSDVDEDILRKEAASLAQLQHPNIISIYALEEDHDGPFMVMELVKGETIKTVIDTAAFPEESFVEFAEQSLDALVAANEAGFLHRDIKPENIMLNWLSKTRFQVKFLDFGLAKAGRRPSIQTTDQNGDFLGSINYIAPEQFLRRPLDARTDLYAFGCVCYFTLTRRHAFSGDTPAATMNAHLQHRITPLAQLRPDLSEPICDWVMQLIAMEPGDRPASARQALHEFRQAISDESLLQRPSYAPSLHSSAVLLLPPPVKKAAPLQEPATEVPPAQSPGFGAAIAAKISSKPRWWQQRRPVSHLASSAL